jgi:tRNA nucleotidyltransferase (CCA-adding enzyme)
MEDPRSMRTYRVGGCVRDALLGRPSADEDFVVVGATPEEMVARGFRPVGRDFPVFIDPATGAEYALARTERKSGRGYHGFTFHASPDVTLEEDLGRRDLTINAMAQDESGRLIDPFGGERDLRAGVLRHVGPAFAEDPLRVLRVARFAARFGFRVAPETAALLRRIVESGELTDLAAERVWQELARGLMETRPSPMFDVLRASGALAAVLPEVEKLFGKAAPRPPSGQGEDAGAAALRRTDYAAGAGYALAVRFACLVLDVEPGGLAVLCERLRVPNECRDVARLAQSTLPDLHAAQDLDAEGFHELLLRADALRRPERLASLVDVGEADWVAVRGGSPPCAPRVRILAARGVLAALDLEPIAAAHRGRPSLPGAIRDARTAALRRWLDLPAQAR